VQPEPPPPPNPLRDVVYPLAFYSNAGSLDSATPLTVSPGATVTADFSLHPVPALHLLVKAQAPPRDDASRNTETGAVDFTANFPFGASLQLAGVDLEQLPVHPAPQMPGYFEVSNFAPGEILFRSAATARADSASRRHFNKSPRKIALTSFRRPRSLFPALSSPFRVSRSTPTVA